MELEGQKSFQMINQDISSAPILMSRNYSKGFYIFSFALEDTIAKILLQKMIKVWSNL